MTGLGAQPRPARPDEEPAGLRPQVICPVGDIHIPRLTPASRLTQRDRARAGLAVLSALPAAGLPVSGPGMAAG
ncbi:hypothetical protein Mth01_01250 [Sphaerimonospora thailandensis]|uniref:Uncharacterized protein n=1 Tax=Sphaerimonospora thailandensis TaxID=795644 RepID=A0A8J3R5T8_9ACTN|nr:hypothetical protein Mth01_01250 [Sphaerimonospora thailandensis]